MLDRIDDDGPSWIVKVGWDRRQGADEGGRRSEVRQVAASLQHEKIGPPLER